MTQSNYKHSNSMDHYNKTDNSYITVSSSIITNCEKGREKLTQSGQKKSRSNGSENKKRDFTVT